MIDFLKDFCLLMIIGILCLVFCGLMADTVFRPVPSSVCGSVIYELKGNDK